MSSRVRTTGHFDGFDFEGFWTDWGDSYHEDPPTDDQLAAVEAKLGFRLPDAYVELARIYNGGTPHRSCFPMTEPTGWAENHIMVDGIYAIGEKATYSLVGELGSLHMRDEWGYPSWGVGFADTPTGGHEQLMLDYRDCGPEGEPTVVYVDQEDDYSVTFVAPDFVSFIKGLVEEDEFLDPQRDLENALLTVRHGSLSPIIARALQTCVDRLPQGEPAIRRLGEQVVEAKGFFALHADELSYRLYDSMFWLYSCLATARSREDYLYCAAGQDNYDRPCYELMLPHRTVADPYGFCTGGWAPAFLEDWWENRLADGSLIETANGFQFTSAKAAQVLMDLQQLTTD